MSQHFIANLFFAVGNKSFTNYIIRIKQNVKHPMLIPNLRENLGEKNTFLISPKIEDSKHQYTKVIMRWI